MRHTQPISTTRRGGVEIATPEETLLVCARHLELLDLVVLGDSALHLGLTSAERLAWTARRRRWGASRLGRALGWMDGRSESAWESLLRVMHRACGVPVVPQHVVRDAEGGFVARGDLWIVGSRMLHEYDGAGHLEAVEYARGLDRDRRLLAAGWNRRAYTAPDLMLRPERILREADDTLGRRHRVDRLDPWLAMHEESLFHAQGQAGVPAATGPGHCVRPAGFWATRRNDTPRRTAGTAHKRARLRGVTRSRPAATGILARMRSLQVTSLEGPSSVQVTEVEEPTAGPDQVVVEVKAVGISWPDLLQTRGEYQIKPDLPFQLGVDFAGVRSAARRRARGTPPATASPASCRTAVGPTSWPSTRSRSSRCPTTSPSRPAPPCR